MCHPFATLYVSFGNSASDEEKYVVLDTGAKHGFRTLVNTSPSIQSTRDLSTSLDLINQSDAACILLSPFEAAQASEQSQYRQIFETLSCYSLLSRGNIWVFTKDAAEDFGSYLSNVFGQEKIGVIRYSDANHLRALFERNLEELESKRKKELAKQY